MNARTNIPGATDSVLQAVLAAYSDEAYTNAQKIANTGVAGTNPDIDVSTETFIGQMRWKRPLNAKINVVSITDPTDGTPTDQSSALSTYVKTVRSHGAMQVNMKQVVTQEDGLAKIARDFAETQSQDEDNAFTNVLRGVAITELLYGANTSDGTELGLGGQTFENDPTSLRYGFYVDLGNVAPIIPATPAVQGAARAEGFLRALGMGWKDYEAPYYYLSVTPEVMMSLRSANMVDADRVVEANIELQTILNGKFRLLPTRTNLGLSAAEMTAINGGLGVDLVGTKCSFIMLPATMAMQPIPVPMSTEIFRNARAYQGGGTTDIWYRWGYVAHPKGYSWHGSEDEFVSDAGYKQIRTGNTIVNLAGATVTGPTKGVWTRKTTSVLTLGILPVFHG